MIIETTDLKRNFKVGSETIQALKGVNLSIDKGEPLVFSDDKHPVSEIFNKIAKSLEE